MYALVKLYYICPLDSITKTSHGTYRTKFKEDSYDVDIVSINSSYDILQQLKGSLCSNTRQIGLDRCDDANNTIQLLQDGEFPLQTKIKEDISEEKDFVYNSGFNENIEPIVLKTKVEEEYSLNNPGFLDNHNYYKVIDEESSSNQMEEELLHKTELVHDDTFEEDCITFDDSDLDHDENPNQVSQIPLSGKNWDKNTLIENVIEVNDISTHPTGSDLKYPDYRLIEEDLSTKNSLSTPADEIQNNGTSLPDEPLPFYTDEMQTKISFVGKKRKECFCIYCKKLVLNLARHLERKHHEQHAVKNFCSHPKGSQKRRAILGEILRRGNFIYNTNRKYNNGQLLVAKRPAKGSVYDPDAYTPCPECKAFYLKRTMRRHYARWHPNKKRKRQSVLPLAKITHGQIHIQASESLKNDIFPYLKDGEPVKIIRYDSLAIAYGNYLCIKHNKSEHRTIKKLLRYTGRLLIAVKNVDPSINDLASLINPLHVETVVQAINCIAEYDEKGQYKIPSAAWHLKKVCRDIVDVWKMERFCKRDSNSLQQADEFLDRFGLAFENEMYYQNEMRKMETQTLEVDHEYVSTVKHTKKRWSPETKAAFLEVFQNHLDNKTLPSNRECEMAMRKIPGLRSKTVAAVKTAVMNEIRRREFKQT